MSIRTSTTPFETLQICGVNYLIIDRKTPGDMARTHPLAAQWMWDNDVVEDLILRRPNGSKIYFTRRWKSGIRKSPPVRI